MSIINYHDPTVINWNLDNNGKPVSIAIENEVKQIVDGKISLEGLPDEQYRVQISNFIEVNIREKIDNPEKFKCDYTHGVLYFDHGLEGQVISIDKYYSRGQFYTPANRIWTKLNDFDEVTETLEDVVDDIDIMKDVISNYYEVIDSGNELKSILDNTIQVGNNLKDNFDGFIASTDYEQLILNVDDLKSDQHNHNNKSVLDGLSDNVGSLQYQGQDVGIGDMTKAEYDTNNDGKIDISENAEKLGGQLPSHYATKSELSNVETSAKTYTDTEMANLIGSAPETLDTLHELADALGQDPNFATTVMTEIGKKETPSGAQSKADAAEQSAKSYVDGKVLTDVPLNAKFTDTVYSHPSSHPVSMITESSTKRFVSDSEKSTWNSKSDTDTVTTINGKTGAISKADIVALGIPSQDTVVDISGKVDKDIVGEANGIAPLDSEGKVPSVFLNHLVFSIEKPTNGAVLWFEEIVQ